jgi:hypothetical protein
VAVFAAVAAEVGDAGSDGKGDCVATGDCVGSSKPGTCGTFPCPTKKLTVLVPPGGAGMLLQVAAKAV